MSHVRPLVVLDAIDCSYALGTSEYAWNDFSVGFWVLRDAITTKSFYYIGSLDIDCVAII